MLIDDVAGCGQQMKKDGCRDVVGQIADHPQSLTSSTRQSGEVDVQHVRLDDVEPSLTTQPRGEVSVQLDHGQRLQLLEQRQCHGTEAGTYLDHGIT